MERAEIEQSLFRNSILRALDSACLERLHLVPRRLEAGQHIVGPQESVRSILFLESGVVADGILMADGSRVETGVFGSNTIVSATALLGVPESPNDVVVRSTANGHSCSLIDAVQEFGRMGAFHDLALKCIYAQILQGGQVAACNGRHDVEQRLCRWLLQYQDQSDGQEICGTHEELGEALAVRRTTVTVAMDALRSRALISYSRGRIHVLDRGGLEACACECYGALRERLDPFAASESRVADRRALADGASCSNGTEYLTQSDRSRQTERRSHRYIQ